VVCHACCRSARGRRWHRRCLFSLPNGQLSLQEALLAPSTSTSLLSISALDAAGFGASFQGGCCALHHGTELILVAPRCAASYTVHAPRGAIATAVTAGAPVNTRHRRLGHAGGLSALHSLCSMAWPQASLPRLHTCENCVISSVKHARWPSCAARHFVHLRA
jgi:hypothetical protein